jgi:cell wall-associated NlpC family hydrolase
VDEHTVAGVDRPRRRTSHRAVFLSILVTVGLVGGMAPAASADPTSPAQIEAQLTEAWNKLEPLIEQYNDIHTQLQKKQAAVKELQKQIAPLQLEVDLAMQKTSDIAAEYYKGGNASTLNALLTSGSPGALADQLSVLDQMARAEKASVANVQRLKDQLEVKKAPIDALVAELSAQDKQLVTMKKTIDAEIERLNGERLKAYGQGDALGVWRPVACPQRDPGGKASIAINWACHQIGKPYRWAAAGPNSYDCSGLTMMAWKQAGISLPHQSAEQRSMIPAVSESNLRPGDLIFYFSPVHHVSIYVGNGWVVNAPRAGDHVRMARVHDWPVTSYGRPAS